MKPSFEIIDHGIDHDNNCPDYATNEKYGYVVTGSSYNGTYIKALDSAIDQIADSHDERPSLELLCDALYQELCAFQRKYGSNPEAIAEANGNDMYYFVVVRYNLPPVYEAEYDSEAICIYDFSDADPGL